MKAVPKSVTCLTKRNPAANESKFWAVGFEQPDGPDGTFLLRRWWGRIGTEGQNDAVGPFSEERCLGRARELVAAKLREGYRRQDEIDFEAPFLKTESERAQAIAAVLRWIGPPDPRPVPQAVERADERARARLGRYETALERSAKQRESAVVVSVVVLSSERVIDFED
jgi:predicted DNA-binding WGR domain protein